MTSSHLLLELPLDHQFGYLINIQLGIAYSFFNEAEFDHVLYRCATIIPPVKLAT